MLIDFEIIYLADARELIVPLAPMFIDQWEPYYGRQGPGDAETDLNDCCNHDEIPLALIAVGKDQKILGTAALKARSIDTHRYLSPWLAAMFVVERYRGQGIGVALIEEIEKNAIRLGYNYVYVGSGGVTPAMRTGGWSLLDESEATRGPIQIFKRNLQGFQT
jgi:GNAT superfamily N-acetyltransferase